MITTLFLHGLDSSGNGTKGQFFKKHFPAIQCPDFSGTLDERLEQLEQLCRGKSNLQLIGSSFGGLMAVNFSLLHPIRVRKLILLAPALNFEGFVPPDVPLEIKSLLIIGKEDTVTPIDPVVFLAKKTLLNLETQVFEDDHLLHSTFPGLDWENILIF